MRARSAASDAVSPDRTASGDGTGNTARIGATEGPAGAADAPAGSGEQAYLIQVSRAAMACEFDLFLNARRGKREGDSVSDSASETAIDPGGNADNDSGWPDPERAVRALELLDALEDQMSVYRAHSEISRINQRAAIEPVEVEPRLFGLLQLAYQLCSATQGAFDITSTPLSRAWGFWRREGRFPTDEERCAAVRLVDWRQVRLDPTHRTITFLRPGVEINLNAIGKGYALDRCADYLLHTDSLTTDADCLKDFVIHGGQSSILARGSRSGYRGWTVTLRNPLRPEQRLREIVLHNAALGTSGSGTQFFYHQGRRYGHLIDPRSGFPAEAVLSATVVAPTAAEADALATAFYVMGWEATAEYCGRHPHIGALLVLPGERAGAIEVRSIGIPPSDTQPDSSIIQ